MEHVTAGHHQRGLRVVGIATNDAVGIVGQIGGTGRAILRAETRFEARIAAQRYDAFVDRLF